MCLTSSIAGLTFLLSLLHGQCDTRLIWIVFGLGSSEDKGLEIFGRCGDLMAGEQRKVWSHLLCAEGCPWSVSSWAFAHAS